MPSDLWPGCEMRNRHRMVNAPADGYLWCSSSYQQLYITMCKFEQGESVAKKTFNVVQKAFKISAT